MSQLRSIPDPVLEKWHEKMVEAVSNSDEPNLYDGSFSGPLVSVARAERMGFFDMLNLINDELEERGIIKARAANPNSVQILSP